FNPNADVNNDGVVNSTDSTIVTTNLGHRIVQPAPPKLVILEGSGTPNDNAIDFGKIPFGGQSAAIFVLLENTGALPLSIAGMQLVGPGASGYTFKVAGQSAGTTSFILPPNSSASIEIDFVATAPGSYHAALDFFTNDNAAFSPSISLDGSVGIGPRLVVLESSVIPNDNAIDFGTLKLPATPAPIAVTLKNTGDQVLTIAGMQITGAGAAAYTFQVSGHSNGTTSFIIAAGGSVNVVISFVGTLAGSYPAQLKFFHNDPTQSQPFALSIAGSLVSLLPPQLVVLENSGASNDNVISFGTVTLPITPAPITVTLKNTGDQPLSIVGMQISGDGAAAFSFQISGHAAGTTSFIVAPGGSVDVLVSLVATLAGTYAAQLKFFHSDPVQQDPYAVSISATTTLSSPHLVVLENIGTPNDNAIDFGSVLLPVSAAPITVTLENTGGQSLTIAGMQMAGTDSSAFSFQVTGYPAGTASFIIAPGASVNVQISLLATTVGGFSAQLKFFHNDPSQLAPFSLSIAASTLALGLPSPQIAGVQVSPPLSVTPPSPPKSHLFFLSSPSDSTAGQKLNQVTIYAEDASGNIVITDHSKVTLQILGGPDGTKLLGTTTVKFNHGIATFRGLSIQKAGDYSLTAIDAPYTSAVSGTFAITAATASKLVFVSSPTSSTIGSYNSFTLESLDRFGNRVTTDHSLIDITLKTHPNPGTLAGTLSTALVGGLATFDDLTLSTPGKYTFQFTELGNSLHATTKTILVS
ncbi:MAG TPA: choice-of-anchor D domain-containing protein, partial [Phycisphaerae bacterium]